MQYQEFIDRVQERADLESREEAERAVEATLETLGERLYITKARHLAAQLPDALKRYVLKRKEEAGHPRKDVDRYSLDEFYNRVAARANIRYSHAVERSRIVMAVLHEAITEGELADLLSELPDDYRDVLSSF